MSSLSPEQTHNIMAILRAEQATSLVQILISQRHPPGSPGASGRPQAVQQLLSTLDADQVREILSLLNNDQAETMVQIYQCFRDEHAEQQPAPN